MIHSVSLNVGEQKLDNEALLLLCFNRLNKEILSTFTAEEAEKVFSQKTKRLTKAKNERKHHYSIHNVDRFDD